MSVREEDNDETRKRISVLIDEITATTQDLLAKGIDPGHAIDKRQALAIVKRITERAYSPQQEKLAL